MLYDRLIHELDQQIENLQKARALLGGGRMPEPRHNSNVVDIEHGRKRRKMSADAKHRISIAQRKRWRLLKRKSA